MAHSSRVGTRKGEQLLVDTSTWVEVDSAALAKDREAHFKRRRRAIQLYLDGATDKQLRAQTGESRANVYRIIVNRCLVTHDDGNLYGWRGALPHLRISGYTRKAPLRVDKATGRGAVGALQWIFASHAGAQLEARFRNRILNVRKIENGTKRRKLDLYKWFLDQLREAKLHERGEWPFNVENQGLVTIYKFIGKVLAENPKQGIKILGGPDAQRKAKAGDGSGRPNLPLYQRVECDAHKLDCRFTVLVPTPHGGDEPILVHRLWVIVIIEVASRAVLGYHLSLRRECNSDAVLRAIRSALTKWTPKKLSFTDIGYSTDAGFPSAKPDFLGACWDEFSVDGAMANVSKRIAEKLSDIVGAKIIAPTESGSFSRRRTLDDRPYIESFFRNLASSSLQRLSTGTGGKHQDKRGADPERMAKQTHFQVEHLAELLDVIIANYNGTPHSGLGYRSPLAQLDYLSLLQETKIRKADPAEVQKMVTTRRLCTVKGGAISGRRPYINFSNARYSSEWLALRHDLLGKQVWAQTKDEDDARIILISDRQGLFLGALQVAPPWHRTPHSLAVRSAIARLVNRRQIFLSNSSDAVEEFINYCESQEGGKLPAHPAYLELRRILQGQDKEIVAWGIRSAANEIAPSVHVKKNELGLPRNQLPESAEATENNPPTRKMAIRKGKTW